VHCIYWRVFDSASFDRWLSIIIMNTCCIHARRSRQNAESVRQYRTRLVLFKCMNEPEGWPWSWTREETFKPSKVYAMSKRVVHVVHTRNSIWTSAPIIWTLRNYRPYWASVEPLYSRGHCIHHRSAVQRAKLDVAASQSVTVFRRHLLINDPVTLRIITFLINISLRLAYNDWESAICSERAQMPNAYNHVTHRPSLFAA